MQSSQPVTFLAWYGAILSTLGFALALYVALRDRSRLKITIQANMRSYGGTGYDPAKRYVTVTVANLGRRTVTVAAVGFSTAKGGGDILLTGSVQGTSDVSEGKAVTFLAEQEGFPFSEVRRVIVRDAAGRVWSQRVPRTFRSEGGVR